VSRNHVTGSSKATTGTPSNIHWKKLSSIPRSLRKPMAIRLVGEPTGVPMPPMEAA
jgi:hypothetical protein